MLGQQMKILRAQQGLSQKDLASLLFVSPQAVGKWERDEATPNPDAIKRLAEIFSVSTDYLLGNSTTSDGPKVIRAPVLGKIPAGVPLEAIDDILDWEELPPEMGSGGREYFGLQVKGDSMYPDFLDGDVVILQKTPCCKTGDVCAVYVNGFDATLKRVKFAEDGSVTLVPRNPEYPPRTYTPEEIEKQPITIAGVVVELRRKF